MENSSSECAVQDVFLPAANGHREPDTVCSSDQLCKQQTSSGTRKISKPASEPDLHDRVDIFRPTSLIPRPSSVLESIYNLRSYVKNPVTGEVKEFVANNKPKKSPDDAPPVAKSKSETDFWTKNSQKHSKVSSLKVFTSRNGDGSKAIGENVNRFEKPKLAVGPPNSRAKSGIPSLAAKDKIATGFSRTNTSKTFIPRPRTYRNPITGEGMDVNYGRSNNFVRSGVRIQQPPGGISSGIF